MRNLAILLVFSSMLFNGRLFAHPDLDQARLEVRQKRFDLSVREITKRCMTVDSKNIVVNFSDENYYREFKGASLELSRFSSYAKMNARNNGSAVRNGLETFVNYGFYPKDEDYWLRQEIIGYYRNLERDLAQKANRENSTIFQKVCLATCVSNLLLDIDDENKSRSMRSALEDGLGVCENYVLLTRRLLAKMGIEAGREYVTTVDAQAETKKLYHTILSIKDGQEARYLFDPQDLSCTFYR